MRVLSSDKRKFSLENMDIWRIQFSTAFPEDSRLTSIVPRFQRLFVFPDTGNKDMVLKILSDTR